MAEFYTILTSVGLAKLINAQLTSDAVTITEVAVGDSNGAYYEPTQNQTKLRKEVWRGRVASVTQDATNSNWIITEVAIPADDGNFTIREVGVFDQDGDMIAIGKYPQTYKPIATNGSVKDLIIRLILEINNINSINIQIDPTVAIASRKYVNDRVDEIMNLIYTPATVSLSTNPNVSVKEYGEIIDKIVLSAAVLKKTQPIKKVEFYRGSSLINTITTPNPDGGTFVFTEETDITDTVTFKAKVYDERGSAEGTKTINFVYPFFAGSLAINTASPIEEQIESLTKLIKTKSNTTHSFTAANARFVFAYPASYGALTSILDQNGFETIGSYNLTTVSITGLNGTAIMYNVYTLATPTTQTDFLNTFKF